MDNTPLNHIVKFINQNMYENETLAAHLSKAKALAEVAMGGHFLEQDATTQYNYLWALRDLLKDADQLNEQQLASWMEHLGDNKDNRAE